MPEKRPIPFLRSFSPVNQREGLSSAKSCRSPDTENPADAGFLLGDYRPGKDIPLLQVKVRSAAETVVQTFLALQLYWMISALVDFDWPLVSIPLMTVLKRGRIQIYSLKMYPDPFSVAVFGLIPKHLHNSRRLHPSVKANMTNSLRNDMAGAVFQGMIDLLKSTNHAYTTCYPCLRTGVTYLPGLYTLWERELTGQQ
jgi:hypothetical protein